MRKFLEEYGWLVFYCLFVFVVVYAALTGRLG